MPTFIDDWRDAILDVNGSPGNPSSGPRTNREATSGVRDQGALESSLAQPSMSFGGQELYPTLAEKAANLCPRSAMNHPFVDGNKQIAHAAMETFLAAERLRN